MSKVGPIFQDSGAVEFRVWAPRVGELKVISPEKPPLALERTEGGLFVGISDDFAHGDHYQLELDGEKKRPDPVSHHLPQGVHGFTKLYDHGKFSWSEGSWKGLPLAKAILYELHPGTFSEQGTFQGILEKLEYLRDIGITAIEIMPVAAFPGPRNWGYDGVNPFAIHQAYGGPDGLKTLINRAHQLGLAVGMDIVYNHMGPEGNYFHDFGPYFTQKFHTPWGDALNFGTSNSHQVREYFLQNIQGWVKDYHLDFLRMDAIHEIFDMGARHILLEMSQVAKKEAAKMGKDFFLIGESDLNDKKIFQAKEFGGWELDGTWADEIHHGLHTLITGENKGYYSDFSIDTLAKGLERFFVYDGNFRPSQGRHYGASTLGIEAWRFISNIQNHDQIGNRAYGDRLTGHLSLAQNRLVLAFILLHPGTPLVFQGQEYLEKNPFQYFVSHGDPGLLKAVSQGRREEFRAFGWDDVPDPAEEQTFLDSKLNWNQLAKPPHAEFLEYFRTLTDLRKTFDFLSELKVGDWRVGRYGAGGKLFVLEIPTERGGLILAGNFGEEKQAFPLTEVIGDRQIILLSNEEGWNHGEPEDDMNPWELRVYL